MRTRHRFIATGKKPIPPMRKNVSRKIPNGTVVFTRDEFFEDHNGYIKEKYRNSTKLYRETTVIDSNRNNELALIKHQSNGVYYVVNNKGQKEFYNPYIKTKDDKGNPIKLGEKFQRGPSKYNVSPKSANKMKIRSIKNKNDKTRKTNQMALKSLKGRKK